jgi:hypothetical protein
MNAANLPSHTAMGVTATKARELDGLGEGEECALDAPGSDRKNQVGSYLAVARLPPLAKMPSLLLLSNTHHDASGIVGDSSTIFFEISLNGELKIPGPCRHACFGGLPGCPTCDTIRVPYY